MTFPLYVSVVPDVAIDKTLDYGVPAALIDRIHKGSRVQISIRGALRTGYVLALKTEPEVAQVKAISQVLVSATPLTEDLFNLGLWMARYYCAPIGDVLKSILPSSLRGKGKEKLQLFVMRAQPLDELMELCAKLRSTAPTQALVLDVMLKVKKGILLTELIETANAARSTIDALQKKGILLVEPVRVDRSPLINEEYFPTRAKKLNEKQSEALEKIHRTLTNHLFEVHLIHGVTGSGKTEIYIQAIGKTLQMGKAAIMLVPEISLTPQTIERFRGRFPDQIAVLHHRLSHGERFDEWHRIQRGEAKIVIGARSAIFSPVPNLGLIVVDEEHESSYKQTDSTPCYHAREVAVVRGKLTSSAVILGSATPSIESYHNALKGKYQLSVLQNRANNSSMPHVHIIDMRDERQKAGGYTHFSSYLLDGIIKRQRVGEQTILFLNRRGYHTTLVCTHCGLAMKCPHCDTALTFHRNDAHLMCHLCGYNLSPPPRQCPQCNHSDPMKFRGVGTEQIQKTLHAILPDIRTIRIDADTTKHKGSHQKLLRDFGTGKADVLVGTQMIAKGLHFPQVTLVGIVNSDSTLYIPDFRSAETAFQLITQVAGRSGRGHNQGEVVIQTCMPDHSTIQFAAKNNYEDFIQEELKSREFFLYPPYSQLAKILFSGLDAKAVEATAERFRQALHRRLPEGFMVHPTLPAGHPKIKNRYRFQFLVRGPKGYTLSQCLEDVQRTEKFPSKISIVIDINPLSTF